MKNNESLRTLEVDQDASVDGDFSVATEVEDLQEFSDDWTTATSSSNNGGNVTLSQYNDPMEDESQTKETMNQSIILALEAYILVFQNPQKTTKACELALRCISQIITRDYFSGRAGGKDDSSGSGSLQRETPAEHRKPTSLLHRLIIGIQICGDGRTPSILEGVMACLKAIMESPKCSVHELSMLLVIRCFFQIYLSSKTLTCQHAAKRGLVEIVCGMIERMEESSAGLYSLFYIDSYILMKRLVYISSRQLQGVDDNAVTASNFLTRQIFTTASADPRALNNKVLSLELLLIMMEVAGERFQKGEKFVDLIQSHLCATLLKNCISNQIQVAFTSQRIFLVLVYKFKNQLKDEIQVFMKNIFLRVLESEYSSFPQKAIVLESLRRLCEDPFLLTQIFLNYDCDFDGMTIFKDIVTNLSKLAEKSITDENVSQEDDEEQFELSLAATEIIVTILNTFLKTMGMTGEDHKEINDTAGKKIRETLKLEDVGLSLLQDQQEDQSRTGETFDNPEISAVASMPTDTDSSDMLGKIVGVFDRKRTAEQSFELGAAEFTLDVESGLRFFVENNFVKLDAKDIATFLYKNRDKLDKTQIGELLGKEPHSSFSKSTSREPEDGGSGFYIRVLQHYMDAVNFSGLLFDEAIRLFLSGFRLPGEAQKIDRIMEKFAERYTQQNPDVFSRADTAFILAFSIIMLNTDLHNPSIKASRRMTLVGFQRNNSGIGENGSDLPDKFLAGIYERIKENPFSLKEDQEAQEKATANAIMKDGSKRIVEKHKREQFDKEREEMMVVTAQLILQRKSKRVSKRNNVSTETFVAPADLVKPMFDASRDVIIDTLCIIMEASFVRRAIEVCLNGFMYATRIACHNSMPDARDQSIRSLTKLTHFENIDEMNFKHINSIRTVMKVAVSDGEYLGESWGPILECVSRIAKIRMASEEILAKQQKTSYKTERKSFARRFFGNQQETTKLSKETETLMKLGILESVGDQLIDNVFSSTVELSALGIDSFIQQLIQVSMKELEAGGEGKFMMDLTQMYASRTESDDDNVESSRDGDSVDSNETDVSVDIFNAKL
jgi:brefeldin A-inhibited guanine nucleotide-exchange protein